MATPFPRIRSDLVIRRQATRDGTVYVVKDPASGQFFRFGDAEYFILTRLDGATGLDAVARDVETRFRTSLDQEMLADFVRALNVQGLLETGTRPRRRVTGGGLLTFRIKMFDPDRLLGALDRWLGFLFAPGFVASAVVTITTALFVVVTQRQALVDDIMALDLVRALVVAWITILAVGMAHELAHGLTCKHFGGEVREIGFLLIYFQPALYCNVSDAWLFPEKSRRLWVMLAGSGFELLLWAMSVLVWRVTETKSPVHTIALIVAATSGVKTLLNFNPLLKLDGYYLLSDWLEIPNLRRRSFEHVGVRIRAWLGRRGEPTVARTPRERRIYMAYGVLALVFSFAFLGFITLHFGHQLLGRYRALGLLPLGAFVVIMARGRFAGLAPARGAVTARADVSVATRATTRGDARARNGTALLPPPSADLVTDPTRRDDMVQAPHAAADGLVAVAPARPRRRFRAVATAACLALAAGAMAMAPMNLQVAGGFVVVPLRNAEVCARTDGFVDEVRVREGDPVRPGDVVARLSRRDGANELAKARIDLAEQRRLLDYARINADRSRTLFQSEVLSRKDWETAEQQVEISRAEVARLEAQCRFLQSDMAETEVVSPIEGVVTSAQRDLDVLRGRFFRRGEVLARVDDLRRVTAEITVPEKEISDVVVGQPIVLEAHAYPGRRFQGRVLAIGARVHEGDASAAHPIEPGNVLVTTELDNAGLALKPAMSGFARIHCRRERAGRVALHRITRTIRPEFWSWW